MTQSDRPDPRQEEARHAIRDAQTLDALKNDHATVFAVIAAAPDAESAVAAIASRFKLSPASAEHLLHQPINRVLPRPEAG